MRRPDLLSALFRRTRVGPLGEASLAGLLSLSSAWGVAELALLLGGF